MGLRARLTANLLLCFTFNKIAVLFKAESTLTWIFYFHFPTGSNFALWVLNFNIYLCGFRAGHFGFKSFTFFI